MTVAWSDYAVRTSVGSGPTKLLDAATAKARHEDTMAQKPYRIEQLRALLARNGVAFGASDDAIRELNQWVADRIELDAVRTDMPTAEWLSVAEDIALFLGDVRISRDPERRRWSYCEKVGKDDINFQKTIVESDSGSQFDMQRVVVGNAVRLVSKDPGRPLSERDRIRYLVFVNPPAG